MGLFDKSYKPKSSDPGEYTFSTTPTATKTKTWDIYDPKKVTSGYNAAATPYGGAEQSAITRLNEILQHGGYSPETQKQLAEPGINTILQESERQRDQAQADAYSRGLGQSGVLSRSYGEVDRSTQSAIGQLLGDIQAQGAQMVPGAVSSIQTGQAQAMEDAQFNAQMAQSYEELKSQLSLGDAQLQQALTELNATIDMSNADRDLQMQDIASRYNMDRATLNQAYQLMLTNRSQDDKNRTASFFANLIGGGAALGSAAIGAPKAAVSALGAATTLPSLAGGLA